MWSHGDDLQCHHDPASRAESFKFIPQELVRIPEVYGPIVVLIFRSTYQLSSAVSSLERVPRYPAPKFVESHCHHRSHRQQIIVLQASISESVCCVFLVVPDQSIVSCEMLEVPVAYVTFKTSIFILALCRSLDN